MAPMKHILKRTLQGAAVLVVLLAVAGVTYELIGEHLDARRFPQQGVSIRLGPEFANVSLNLDCSGPAGSKLPTVILDSGLGVPAVGWELVQREVARFTRVCSYDRAGYGWSSASPLPRTSLQIVKELHALLAAAGVSGPFVMVGHSFGGYDVRIYTSQYPQDVVGMVLVDASHEDQVGRLPPALRAMMKPPSDASVAFAHVLFYLGLTRALSSASIAPELPREFVEKLLSLQRSPKFAAASMAEFRLFEESSAQVRAAGNLGDRPLIVLTAGKAAAAAGHKNGVTQRDLDEQHRIWTDELQVQLSHLSTDSKRIIVRDSGHLIPFEKPDAVTAAIREVCEAVTTKHPLT